MLFDSSLEHYRGGFYNRTMFAAPVLSALCIVSELIAMRRRRSSRANDVVSAAATLGGIVGTGFHVYNVSKREGGVGWLNLFYAAPIAAPLGLTFAGLFGIAAGLSGTRPGSLGRPLGIAAAAGLLGTGAEAGMLHFRGAFHNKAMFVPVTVPPAAGAALIVSALRGRGSRLTRTLLWSTVLAGALGTVFHAWGVHRNMGGWKNWSQNIQVGPPLPAPPSFSGMALAGLAALDLLEEQNDD